MKKLIICLLLLSSINLFSRNDEYIYKGRAAAYDSYNASATSMALWGAGLAIGIGIICYLIKGYNKNSTSS